MMFSFVFFRCVWFYYLPVIQPYPLSVIDFCYLVFWLSVNIVIHDFRQLECEGHQAQDHRDWKDEVHAQRASQVQEQLQRRYCGCPEEEHRSQLGL